jgi:anion-transporting  ArsA/GET3 family ATPase
MKDAPRVVSAATAPGGRLDVDGLIDDRSVGIIVCCGSGGVGKTTTSAALALRAAERGRTVCVLTIDPARRLAQALGLTELSNDPHPVEVVGEGTLDAMMLDMKSTFDEVVEAHASPEKAEQILANPFYIALSSSFAGTQEYMAMEKLGQLHAAVRQDPKADGQGPRWDLIIVDTPPSRSALDFLDAPDKLATLLDGRFIRLILAPAKGPARLLTAGFSVVSGALNKIIGAQFLRDLQGFIAAFDTLFGGFRQRAEATYALLKAPGTAFLVIASPEPDALREASYFVERLAADDMPLAGVVINRVDSVGEDLDATDAESASHRLSEGTEIDRQVAELLAVHAVRRRRADRQARVEQRFGVSHRGVPRVRVAALAEDVHDLEGLRLIGTALNAP